MITQRKSDTEGDENNKLLRSSWTTGFESLGKPEAFTRMEEKWVFEEDTYTLGGLAVVERGIRGAWLHFMLALLTPTIQFTSFFLIFENLVTEPCNPDEKLESGSILYVRLICFFLMALQVSNEALEGLQKTVFCLRALTGAYVDLRGNPHAGIFLCFLQVGMSMGTSGLSMLVVSQQTTALDAFMNYVALAFLTEVDNILMSARTVQNFVEVEKTEITAVLQPTAFDAVEVRPWTLQMMGCANTMMIMPTIIGGGVVWLATQASEDPEDVLTFMGRLPSALLLLVGLNLIMWFGSLRFGAVGCSLSLVFLCFSLDFFDKSYLYTTHQRLFSPVVLMVAWWFEFASVVTSFAIQRDPARLLRCPIKAPAVVWAMLLQAVFFFDSLHRFGAD